jgi:transposase
LDILTDQAAPSLRAAYGVGPDSAAELLVAAGDNPDRLASEASFAALCGVAPVPASSGKTNGRFRPSRGGNRRANAALYRVVLCRLRWDPATRAYMDRRTKEGMSKKEIIRCLKRYLARTLYQAVLTDYTAITAMT